jgi:SHS2 domain-containing protein
MIWKNRPQGQSTLPYYHYSDRKIKVNIPPCRENGIHYNQVMNSAYPKNGFCEIPHRADLALKVWAADLPGLFIQSAQGMYSLMGIQVMDNSRQTRKIIFRESDYESLLVSFLNELLSEAQQEAVVYDTFHFDLNHFEITADLIGSRVNRIFRDIKAVTYHDLRIHKTRSGYETQIVFDI